MKEIPFVAIGNNELGKEVGTHATCPNCGELHEVKYGKDKDGKILKLLGFVDCPPDSHSYLIAINGREIESLQIVGEDNAKNDLIDKVVREFAARFTDQGTNDYLETDETEWLRQTLSEFYSKAEAAGREEGKEVYKKAHKLAFERGQKEGRAEERKALLESELKGL